MYTFAYGYDGVGNRTAQTQTVSSTQTITNTYDALNRLITKTYPVNSGLMPITYTYDAGTNGIGQRTSMSDGSGAAAWTYDNRGRMTTEAKTVSGAGTFTTSTSYDAADRVRTLTYPTGEVITQAYSARGLLNGVRSQSNNQWLASNLAYNANGSLSRTDLGNGLSTLYGYYGIGNTAFGANSWDAGPASGLGSYARLWRIRSEAPSGQPLLDLRYAYDAAGNVTAWHDGPRSITGTLAVTLSDSFDSLNGATWVKSSSGVTIPYNDGGSNDAQLIGNAVDYSVMLTRTSNSLVSGGGMQVRFKVDNTLDSFSLGISTNNSPLQRLSVADEGTGHLAVQYYDGAGKIYPIWLTPTLQANPWYTLAILVDDVRGHTPIALGPGACPHVLTVPLGAFQFGGSSREIDRSSVSYPPVLFHPSAFILHPSASGSGSQPTPGIGNQNPSFAYSTGLPSGSGPFKTASRREPPAPVEGRPLSLSQGRWGSPSHQPKGLLPRTQILPGNSGAFLFRGEIPPALHPMSASLQGDARP